MGMGILRKLKKPSCVCNINPALVKVRWERIGVPRRATNGKKCACLRLWAMRF